MSLKKIIPYSVLDEALVVVRTVDLHFRASALMDVVKLLPLHEQQNVLDEALAVARTIDASNEQDDGFNVFHFVEIIEQFPPHEALAIAHTIKGNRTRAETILSIATRLPSNERQHLYALGQILQHLPPDANTERLEVLHTVCTLRDGLNSGAILTMLVPYWSAMCYANADLEMAEVTNILHAFATAERKTLLKVVGALIPVIARLGGERAVDETVQAIIDITRWWP